MKKLHTTLLFAALALLTARAQDVVKLDVLSVSEIQISEILPADSLPPVLPPSQPLAVDLGKPDERAHWVSPYMLPYSRHVTGGRNWHRMWINTAVLSGAFIGTLFVLECLPEDATSWNRAALQDVPLFTRWGNHVFKDGPEWDHDKFVFNYVLHPYAGAAYFMAARSCGFSFWGSFLYSFCISNIGWEFGIEAFMERPSYQDLVITPVVGSLLGELCYKGKRSIMNRGYELLGSRFLGRVAAFFLDPVNEVVDIFRGNPALEVGNAIRERRNVSGQLAFTPRSLSLRITF